MVGSARVGWNHVLGGLDVVRPAACELDAVVSSGAGGGDSRQLKQLGYFCPFSMCLQHARCWPRYVAVPLKTPKGCALLECPFQP